VSRVVTSVRVESGPGHDLVHVWNRGGKAGTLTVRKGDGEVVAARLRADGVDPPKKAGPPKHLGLCYKCRKPVMHGDECWGYHDCGVWKLTLDGYLHHKVCSG